MIWIDVYFFYCRLLLHLELGERTGERIVSLVGLLLYQVVWLVDGVSNYSFVRYACHVNR